MPSTKLRLPKRLEETLKHNPGLYGGVLVSLDELDPWIADNKLPFFPEYTDHGPDHINRVFVTAEALIWDEAWPHVTPEDVAVLVLAILLHDCAMHLSEEGFVALLKAKDWAAPVSTIDTTTWPDLWDDFLREAARFDGKKLTKLFGNAEPAKRPPLDALSMTKRDRLLIGEFLRRHHPRLAHEIALQGVPGPTTTPLKLKSIERKLADLGGLVARSHGMSLRAAADLLPADERRETRNVHAPFLMSVLRIADYIQIDAERAPSKLLQVRSLNSPVSVGEWKKHDAIETIHNRHDDPDALYVKALPKDGATYVGLKRLFASIQEELDDVWAVLGEVYGRVDDLRNLGIVIRRLRSNLDDEKAFAKSVDYVPGQAEFQAASADLLKLLVGPLYGNRPEVGIRELLQNAVDACRELEDYLKQHEGISAPELTEQEADVVITFHTDKDDVRWLVVSDRGIGMTPEVVKEYFLKAGASFRSSDAWRKQHLDSEGKSRVARSGRFGIGVLAAFLLGDRIEVSTRHMSQTKGIEFAATIEDETISLRYAHRSIGTTVKIRIADEHDIIPQRSDHRWDWYCLQSPSVICKITSDRNTSTIIRRQRTVLPAAGANLDHKWRRISHPDFGDIQWTYWDIANVPGISCNGFRIESSIHGSHPKLGFRHEGRDQLPLNSPRISIFDPDGQFPLNLQRSDVDHKRVQFLDHLTIDTWKDFIAHTLANTPSDLNTHRRFTPIGNISYPGIDTPSYSLRTKAASWSYFWLTSTGWSIVDYWFFQQNYLKSILLLNINNPATDPRLGNAHGNRIAYSCTGVLQQDAWFRATVSREQNYLLGPIARLARRGARVLLSQSRYSHLRSGHRRIARSTWSRTEVEWSNSEWVILKTGICPTDSPALKEFASAPPTHNYESIAEWYFPEDYIPKGEPSRLARIWADVVKHPVIPFNLTERRRVLAHAYEVLAPYIAAHEELAKRSKDIAINEDEDNDEV